jgi:hypothetical protein
MISSFLFGQQLYRDGDRYEHPAKLRKDEGEHTSRSNPGDSTAYPTQQVGAD